MIIPNIGFFSDASVQPSGWSWAGPIGATLPEQITSGQFQWNSGQGVDFEANIPNGIDSFISGQKKKLKIQFTYYNPIQGNTYTHKVNGEIYDEVQ